MFRPFFEVEIGVMVGGAVDEAEGVSESRFDEAGAEGEMRSGKEIGFAAKGDGMFGGGVGECDLVSVETDTGEGNATVGGIAEDRDVAELCVDADLMGPSGERFGGEKVENIVHRGRRRGTRRKKFSEISETSFSGIAMEAGGVTIPCSNQAGANGKGFFGGVGGGQKEIGLLNLPGSELLSEGLIGKFGFGEDNQARGGFIEAVDDRERGPARFAIAEPVINSFARVGRGGMRVEARRFVDHEEMVILVQDAGRRLAYQKCHAPL